MSTLTPAQVAAVCARAGFTGPRLTRAVAVVLAESGGRTDAVNVNHDSHRSRDRGLFQINDYWHKEVTDAAAFNPETNARAAYRISNGGRDWSPWSTWKNGAAAAQLGRARLAVGKAAQAPGGIRNAADVPPGWEDHKMPGKADDYLYGGKLGRSQLEQATGQSLGDLVVLAAHAGAWMSNPHNWARVAMVAGGGVGVLVGLQLLAQSGAVGSTAAGVAAIPAKATKAAAFKKL